MRDKLDNPLPETTQAPPASSIFDPRYWLPLTRAFGQFMSIIEARDHAQICINRDLHEGQLRLLLVAPDGTTWEPDASERQKLTVHAPHNFEEGVRIEPYHEGRWYVCRCDLAKLTTIPATPATPTDRRRYAEAPAVRKLYGKEWVPEAYKRRPDKLLAMGITGASNALAEESETAPDCAKPLKARYIEKLLRDLGTFEKADRGLPPR